MAKSEKQKLKIFYIADYLMKETDDELDEDDRPIHGVLMRDIKEHLKNNGIDAEEHSISRDIDLLRGIKRTDDGEEYFESLLDIAGGKGKPIYLCSRYIDYEDLAVIAECIASSKFISKSEADSLINKLKLLCSKYRADELTSDYIVAERPKYTQKKMLRQLNTIRTAIKQNKMITFHYTRHSIKDFSQVEKRRKGQIYTVSPFKVVLSDGNHYLIGYDDKFKKVLPYRIDRMADVNAANRSREGEDKYKRLGISDYARQTFGMFFGDSADRITILFDNVLLDAVLERFGNSIATDYKRVDDKHFTLTTAIVKSENFYGWICGLGGKAIIQSPPDVVSGFKEYLHKIAANYQ
ncbi:MAG: WYL domain-containing protein [Aeriscardovia sp.]|nr:WYL domain-containing protein [Aeriscardovia sp.]